MRSLLIRMRNYHPSIRDERPLSLTIKPFTKIRRTVRTAYNVFIMDWFENDFDAGFAISVKFVDGFETDNHRSVYSKKKLFVELFIKVFKAIIERIAAAVV